MKKLVLSLLVVFFAVTSVMAQRTIEGQLTGSDGLPIVGANVLVKGTSIGTTTDVDGKYALDVPAGEEVIVYSFTGFNSQEITLGSSNIVDLVMEEGIMLDEAVITGLGIEREKKSLGYAVTEVSGEGLENSKEVNIVNALSGKVPGLQVQGTASSLGGSSRVTIRGANSFLGNNQPLFVVDGVPLDNSNFADNSQSRGFGGSDAYDYGNTIQDIDPNSIKEMTVLKGASASALYGQRGANGVILITTKDGSGVKKGLGIELNSSIAFDNVINLIPHQQVYGGGQANPETSHGFYEFNQDGTTYLAPLYKKDGSWGPKYDPNLQVRHWDSWDPDASNYKETRPWVAPNVGYEDYFDTGRSLTNSIALSGSDKRGSFRAGYTNLSQNGVTPNARLNRNSINLNSRYNINDWLSVNVSGNYIKTDAENRNITGYNNGNPMQGFTQWWQTQLDVDRLKNATNLIDGRQYTWNAVGESVDENGDIILFNHAPNFFDNPHWVRENFLQEDTRNRLFGNAGVNIKIAEGLTLNSRFGTDFYQYSRREGIPVQSVEASYYAEKENRFQENNIETRLNYERRLGDNFSLNTFVGTNFMKQFRRSTDASTIGPLALDGFWNLSNSTGGSQTTTDEVRKAINSVFGFASVGFRDFLYLDVSLRNDWSSTLPPEERSYFYPSVSSSIVLSELGGLNNLSFLSFLKLRGSYARVGNDASPYSLYDTYTPLTPNFGSNPRYGVPNAQNNALLKPELTDEFEVGIDVRFFNNRLGFDLAYFDRTTTEQIFSVPTSASTGYTSRFLNAGKMKNNGIEFAMNARPVQTSKFSWDIGFNIFRGRNEVVELAPGVDNISRGNTWAANIRISEGDPYMAIYGVDFVRENYEEDAEGNITRNEGRIVVGEDGLYKTTSGRVFLGSSIPDFTGGLNTSFNFGPLSLSGLLDFQKGGQIHSTSLQWAKYSGMSPETVEFNGESDIRANGMVLPGVKEDGSENDIVITDIQGYYQNWGQVASVAAHNLHDKSFLKLREVRLDYKLPSNLFKGLGSDIYLGVFGRNLAILASDLPYLDPQGITGAGNDQGFENAQVPSTRSFGVNLRVKL